VEILLLIAIIAVAASGLYMAITLNARARKSIVPLIDNKIDTTARDLGKQIQAITDELQYRELAKRIDAASEGLSQQFKAIAGDVRAQLAERIDAASGEFRAIADELRRDGGLAKRLGDQIDVRQGQFRTDLLRLDHRLTQLRDSLADQNARVAHIYRYIKHPEMRAEGSPELDSLVSAMLEAESYADLKGWGKPPRLYALTETNSSAGKDHEFAAEQRDGRPQTLMLVERGPLPDDNLVEVLASIHWPQDVVGCVLVTELVSLPPEIDGGAFVDPVAAGQWASTHPDGRPARLAVGVRRSGEHACGLHVKGDPDVQVRTDLAGNLVDVLRGTFARRT
jgi:hypothetical protein